MFYYISTIYGKKERNDFQLNGKINKLKTLRGKTAQLNSLLNYFLSSYCLGFLQEYTSLVLSKLVSMSATVWFIFNFSKAYGTFLDSSIQSCCNCITDFFYLLLLFRSLLCVCYRTLTRVWLMLPWVAMPPVTADKAKEWLFIGFNVIRFHD